MSKSFSKQLRVTADVTTESGYVFSLTAYDDKAGVAIAKTLAPLGKMHFKITNVEECR